jgi:hypothetical protein
MEATQPLKLNSAGYLRLAYVATEITLHRRILLALHPSTSPELMQICRSVAHERFMFAMDFVQSLKPQHLSSFWYFASPQNFSLIAVFGTLLLSHARNSKEAAFYRAKLREYRWMLKINSEHGARYMRPAMALLDVNTCLLAEAIKSNGFKHAATNSTENQVAENGHGSTIAHHPNESTNSNVSPLSTADFSLPGLFSFVSPYDTSRHQEGISPVTLSSGNNDEQCEEFGYEFRINNDLWS